MPCPCKLLDDDFARPSSGVDARDETGVVAKPDVAHRNGVINVRELGIGDVKTLLVINLDIFQYPTNQIGVTSHLSTSHVYSFPTQNDYAGMIPSRWMGHLGIDRRSIPHVGVVAEKERVPIRPLHPPE